MKELIKEYEKELAHLNERLTTAIYIGANNRIRIDTEINLYEKIIHDLKNLKQ